MSIYKAHIVKALQAYYGDILNPNAAYTLHEHLNIIALKMQAGIASKEECIYSQINNYNPDFLGVSRDILKQKQFHSGDYQYTIANEYGFDSWHEVEMLGALKYNIDFENCVNAIVYGDISKLSYHLKANPLLTKLHSNYGHKATLLHYTASNGVELWRQQVPHNLAEIIKFLLANGADKGAKMNVYGGEFTAYELFTTSAHPINSGINTSIAELLKI